MDATFSQNVPFDYIAFPGVTVSSIGLTSILRPGRDEDCSRLAAEQEGSAVDVRKTTKGSNKRANHSLNLTGRRMACAMRDNRRDCTEECHNALSLCILRGEQSNAALQALPRQCCILPPPASWRLLRVVAVRIGPVMPHSDDMCRSPGQCASFCVWSTNDCTMYVL
jgi:hypothetical protein